MKPDIIIHEIRDSPTNQRYLLDVNGRSYYIGDLFGKIIASLLNGLDAYNITKEIKNLPEYDNVNISQEQIEAIIEKKIKPLFAKEAPLLTRKTSLFSNLIIKKDILSFRHIKPFLHIFRFLFSPYIFLPLFIVALGLNLYYMNHLIGLHKKIEPLLVKSSSDCYRGIFYLVLFYPIAFIILLLHELGHATAAYTYKVIPKSIGAGIYFIFPVLYTDVTDIWRLNKWQRLFVNLGGIYMQLILHLVLIYIVYHTADFDLIETIRFIMILNISAITINIIPFLKFDGYWIYSDLFKLPNLQSQANACWIYFLKKIFPPFPVKISENTFKIFNPKNPYLIVYWVGRSFFLMYLLYRVPLLIIQTFIALYNSVKSVSITGANVCNVEALFNSALILSIISFVIINNTKSIAPLIRRYYTLRKSKV